MAKNAQKMAKNAPNDLKFWHNMYLGGFYWFAKFWKFSGKKNVFSGKKPVFFRRLGKIFKKNWRKIELVLGKCFNWPTNWYKCSSLLQICVSNFWYLAFSQFYGCRNAPRGSFLGKNGQFYQKMALFAHSGSHKIRKKKQDIKNLIHKYVAMTLRNIYTNL